MKRNQPLRQITRFRHWTRKGYAAFASLGRCVTIGCLRKNVTERALAKQTEPSLTPYAQQAETEREAETMPSPDREQGRLLLLLLLSVSAQTDTTPPAEPYRRNNLSYRRNNLSHRRNTLLYSINNGRDALNASCNFDLSLKRRIISKVTRRIQCVYTHITHRE